MKYLICFALLFTPVSNAYCQAGFGFTFTHSDFEDEGGSVENEYMIQYVFKKSPAEKAGLMAGDKIIKFHDAILVFVNTLAMENIIKSSPTTIQLTISRKGIKQTVTITKADRSTYLNVCLQGNCINGTGTFIDQEGTTYTGSFKDKKKEGMGKTFTPGGHTYDGQWKNDKKEGTGIYIAPIDPTQIALPGWSYEGDWKNDSMTGKGKVLYSLGAYYVGDIFRNNRNGNGKLVLQDSTVYEGLWKDNKLNGKGTMQLPNGDKRIGNFIDGNLEGEVKVYTKKTNITTTVLYKKGKPL